MSDDKLSFLDAPSAEPIEAIAPVITPEPEPKIEPPIVPAAPVKSEDERVPLATFLDAKTELRELKRRLAEFEAKPKAAVEIPDPLVDPEGFAAHQTETVQKMLFDQKNDISETVARQTYGDELFDKAVEAFKEKFDPVVQKQIFSGKHPGDALVKWYKKDLLLSEVGDDAAAYKQRIIDEWKAEQATAAGAQQPTAPQKPQAPVIPAASLTKAPSGGAKPSETPVGAGNAFDSVFAS